MADDISDKRQRSKKKRSSLSTWKKKFNIKKRFTNKLPVHGRHIRSLMSGWPLTDVRSVLNQYEITTMLKQLALMSDKSQISCSSLSRDVWNLYQKKSCCDVSIVFCDHDNEFDCTCVENSKGYQTHSALLSNRWPYFRGLLKLQAKKESSGISVPFSQDSRVSDEPERLLPTILVPEMLNNKFSDLLKEIYMGSIHERDDASPHKLQPLPTTSDNIHMRSNKSAQPFRHTILECEHPVVPRRQIVRRKQKQRFSMDERILSNLSPASASSRMQQSRSCKFHPGETTQGTSSHHHAQVWNLNNAQICAEKDIPNTLQDDVLRMYHDAETGIGDVKILFSNESCSTFTSWLTPHSRRRDFSNHYQAWISHYESSNFYSSSASRDWQDPVYCHRVILAARSSYFRRLLQKQMSKEKETSPTSPTILEIEGSVIPPKYMHALLYTMYTDKVDIQRVYERSGQRGIQLGGSPFHLRDAMMLHHIGCFIEFPRLVQGCEEIIIDNLEQNNLLQVLHWTSLPHGSQWVKRQVNNFIREKFTELLSSGILYELSASQMMEILESDFVNASELDILKCALRWGEHELLRRIEEREPNLLTHTAHSISRSKTASARRRELISSRIDELHDCTAPVLACVRIQYLLPPNHEIFSNAVKRGVISRPPAHLLENVNDRDSNAQQWIKEKARSNFLPPRLFQPYVEETKNILDERYAQETDCVSLRSVHNLSREQTWCSMRHQMALASTRVIPDALYMVGHARLPSRRRHGNHEFTKSDITSFCASPPIKYIDNYYPVPEPSTIRELFLREREVRCTPTVSRMLRACIDCCHGNNEVFGGGAFFGRSAPKNNMIVEESEETEYCNRCSAIRLIRLMVVREYGLSDCVVQVLKRPDLYYTIEELQVAMVTEGQRAKPTRASQGTERLGNLAQERNRGGRFLEKRNVEMEESGTSYTHADQNLGPERHDNPQNLKLSLDRGERNLARNLPTSCESGNIPSNSGFENNAFVFDSNENFRSDTFTTTSSDEEEIPQIRRKRRSVSRKGSSSTVSHQSIPDVAASANSSLQRKKSTPPLQGLGSNDVKRKHPFVFKPSPALGDSGGFTHKYSERKRFESSSSSSCEENTSENEESDFTGNRKLESISRYGREFYLTTHPTLRHLPGTNFGGPGQSQLSEIPGTDFSIPSICQSNDPASDSLRKIHPRGGSATISELFTSNLNFIDDGEDFSAKESENSCSELPLVTKNTVDRSALATHRHAPMPELVRDGTLPKGSRGPVTSTVSLVKPDIYPLGNEIYMDSEEQCGKYFFCTIPRECKISKTGNSEESTSCIRQSRTSFSFALNDQKEPKNEENSLPEHE